MHSAPTAIRVCSTMLEPRGWSKPHGCVFQVACLVACHGLICVDRSAGWLFDFDFFQIVEYYNAWHTYNAWGKVSATPLHNLSVRHTAVVRKRLANRCIKSGSRILSTMHCTKNCGDSLFFFFEKVEKERHSILVSPTSDSICEKQNTVMCTNLNLNLLSNFFLFN